MRGLRDPLPKPGEIGRVEAASNVTRGPVDQGEPKCRSSGGRPRPGRVDGRGRVTAWQALLNAGYWSGVVALRAGMSHPHGGTAAEEIVTSLDRGLNDPSAML